ncbi:MaoC family dehydratase N-terminal domain-containing protein [Leifsonia bigeumensis]|uniref:MaoC family dehydratase N-terminal domain-containing protein n=1 Tax=Leifsonella bigeumensis TaxID=433643 RepID=A0ABP7FEC8_9MICO
MPAELDLSPSIDESALEDLRRFEGKDIRVEPYNHEATLDTIRHYAWGIGDDNPLWTSTEHAVAAGHDNLLAPPTFLYSVFDGAIGAGLPGVQPFYAGTRWRFFDYLRRGDAITPNSRFGEVREHRGRTAPYFLVQTALTDYTVGGKVIAHATAETFRVPRRGADGGQGLSYPFREEHVYTDAELDAIREQALNEFRRGSSPLDPARVNVGDVIPAVVKGPIDQIAMTAYYAGCIGSPGYKGVELAWKYRDFAANDPGKLPSNYDPSYFAEKVLPSLGHQNSGVAREIGMPNAYDNGPQRCGWFAHAVTNWMGDFSFLETLEIKLRRPDIFGDTVWIGGEVAGIETAGENARITVTMTGTNQLGDVVATGGATVLTNGGRHPARPE